MTPKIFDWSTLPNTNVKLQRIKFAVGWLELKKILKAFILICPRNIFFLSGCQVVFLLALVDFEGCLQFLRPTKEYDI